MAATTRPGIPTTYAYSDMRSRLEARWAAFFDLVGWPWVYEPVDCDGYIPDFLVKGPRPFFVEVGPCVTRADYEAKAEKPRRVAGQLRQDVLVVGVDPLPEMPSDGGWLPIAGLLGEFCAHDRGACDEARGLGLQVGACEDHGDELSFATAHWNTCRPDDARCGRVAVHHGVQSYASRPCGHHGGDHHLGEPDIWINRLWAQAGNAVQWHPSR